MYIGYLGTIPGFHGYSDIGVHMYACILATLGQSLDGHSILGFHGYSDLGVHMYICMYIGYLGTIPEWTQCPGFHGYSDIGVHMYLRTILGWTQHPGI